ncbi:MAG TPA: CsbD family protein [Casimicrobiaceae bacterium]|nr:CsbD family protein [Casimicrobiaceae bacterium]
MNRDRIEGRLKAFIGAIEEGWGRVIGDQTLQFRGERERSLARMQAGYGALRDRPVIERRRGTG